MTWIDGSRWDADRGQKLTKILIREYNLLADTRALLDDLGLDLGLMPDAPTARVRWIELVRSLHEAQALRTLADYLAREKPALAAELAELAADPPEEMDGNPQGAYDVQLLFGRRPLIDRSELRSGLKRFLERSYPLLVIRGQPRTGKTYSLELLQHVTTGEPNLLLIDVDFAPVANGDSAADLITKLCRRVDVEVMTDEDYATTRTRIAIALVDLFVGRYRNKIDDHRRRILVIDGLNRTDLQDDVHEAVAHLAVEIIKGRLPRTQLVLTGYGGTVDHDLDYGLITEEVSDITEAHVRFFFENLVLPRPLSKREVSQLVQQAQVGNGDVKALAGRVRDLTLDLIGGR